MTTDERRNCLADGGDPCERGRRCRRHLYWLKRMQDSGYEPPVGEIESWRDGFLDGYADALGRRAGGPERRPGSGAA